MPDWKSELLLNKVGFYLPYTIPTYGIIMDIPSDDETNHTCCLYSRQHPEGQLSVIALKEIGYLIESEAMIKAQENNWPKADLSKCVTWEEHENREAEILPGSEV